MSKEWCEIAKNVCDFMVHIFFTCFSHLILFCNVSELSLGNCKMLKIPLCDIQSAKEP
jgi:hypothetical protein